MNLDRLSERFGDTDKQKVKLFILQLDLYRSKIFESISFSLSYVVVNGLFVAVYSDS
jgi:hypothetical protein